ncbi:hypothetical protein RhiLY_02840 [Ceratobasidium sp. AG-Ba]|nr:hypothetical protein RhiLY_02840 [Ceratobasidium sp. AG-Ba]
MPNIWLVNAADTARFSVEQNTGSPEYLAPALLAGWRPTGGKHIEASIDVMERRFIVSSFFRDMVASLKPTYQSTSLFVIATKDTTPLSDDLTTSVTLTPSRLPSLSYLNSFHSLYPKEDLRPFNLCTIVEDHRSSTIFDALGSIGGLFAIFQGVHILLFGRPLFWGVLGTKLISPLGLFGRCRSNRFQRRFRERYYSQPRRDSTDQLGELIRTDAFLRDFVIDFGPGDIDDRVEPARRIHRNTSSEVRETSSKDSLPTVNQGSQGNGTFPFRDDDLDTSTWTSSKQGLYTIRVIFSLPSIVAL